MKLRVLGCSGGIGANLRTTSFLLDDDVLIDAGSGLGDLTLAEMVKIRHIFLTHSHLDHVAFIPLLLDSIFEMIKQPVIVHAQPETIQALEKHIFNWHIWPDFSKLPQPSQPVLKFEPMHPGERIVLNKREFEMIEVNHTVPGVGYYVAGPSGTFAFSGDTTSNDTFWEALNARERLDYLFVEVAFANMQISLAQASRHYCPGLLALDLAKLLHRPVVYLTHLKPSEEHIIFEEAKLDCQGMKLKILAGGEVFQV